MKLVVQLRFLARVTLVVWMKATAVQETLKVNNARWLITECVLVAIRVS